MRKSLKIAGGVLANLSLLSTQVLAYLPEITFEQPTYTPLEMVGDSPDGWESIYGQSSITAAGGGFGGAGQALKIAGNPSEEAWLRKPVSWDAAEPVAFIDFRIKPAATPAGSMANFHANGTQLAFQLPSGATEGELWVLHGNDDDLGTPPDPEQWYLTAGNFTVPSGSPVSIDWVRVTLRHDYGRDLWDLFIDGKLVAVNLGFEGRGGNLQSLDLFGSTAGDTLIDNLAVNPVNMLFADADGDGLPDSWESANGSNPNLYDRESIKPGTGKSFLDHYLDSLWSPGQTVNGATGVGNIGTVPPLSVLAAHQPVGALKGSMSVGGDGSANYSVPIDVPKGTAGMEPKISLNYSSNAGNGIAGLGWSISGLQQIVRGGSTFRKDGAVDGVDFDDKDRFFLDGERLVCVSGTYGAANSVYRTEMDSFARITALGTQGTGTVPGPASWKIETKSGLTVYLGETTTPSASEVATANGNALSWSVTKVEDSLGNYYSVSYTNDPFPGEIRNQRVDKIEYSGYSGSGGSARAPYAGIYFDYETRADKRVFYSSGVRNYFDKRLATVRVKTGTFENHRYELDYFNSEQTGRSLLNKVTKVADGVSIPQTTFEWKTLKHTDPKWVEDGNGGIKEYSTGQDSRNRISGHMYPSDSHPAYVTLTGTAWRAIPFPYTIKHDTVLNFQFRHSESNPPDFALIGLDEDLVAGSSNSRLVKIAGSVTPPVTTLIPSYNHTPVPSSYENIIIPIGARYGLTPGQTIQANYLVLVSDDNTPDGGGVSESTFGFVKAYETSVVNTPTQIAQVPPVTYTINNSVPRMTDGEGDDLGVRVNDFNGDGRSDILYKVMSGLNEVMPNVYWMDIYGEALRRSGNQFVTTALDVPHNVVTSFMGGGNQAAWARRARVAAMPVDINSDGKPDFCYPADIYKVNSLKRGNNHAFISCDPYTSAWTQMANYTLPFESQSNNAYHRFDHFEFSDLDGDSFPDLLVDMDEGSLLSGGSGILVNGNGAAWMNKVDAGQGWVRNDNMKLPKHLRTAGVGDLGRRIFDANADGLPDFIESRSTVAKDLWLNTGTGFVQQSGTSPLQLPVYLTNGNGDDIGTRMIDLNGDGLTDLIKDATFPGSFSTSVHLNTGTGWQKVSDGPPPANAIPNDAWDLPDLTFVVFDKYYEDHPTKTSIGDMNADGLADLVVANTTRNTIYFNTGTSWWESETTPYWATGSSTGLSAATYDLPAPFFRSLAGAQAGKAVATFADVNGDGVTDYISDTDKPLPRVWINQAGPELIEAVVDGFDARLEVEYTHLNSGVNLTHSNKPPYLPLPQNQSFLAGHVESLHGGMVVTRLKESDGMGGFRATRRHYGDIRFDRNNESALGFGWVEVYDEHFQAGGGAPVNRGYTRTENSRTYPFGGSPVAVRTYVNVPSTMAHQSGVTTGTKLVSEETSSYDLLPTITPSTGGTVKRPVQVSSTVKKWDLDGTLMSQVTTTQPTTSFDEHGFLLSSTVTGLDGSQSVTTNVYNTVPANATKWHLGRLTSSSVVKSAPGKATITKQAAFTYNANSGLLETETTQPGHPLAKLTTTTYDIYGNTLSTSVTANSTASGAPQTRTQSFTYDTYGRFSLSETNAIGSSSSTYDHARALLLSTTDFDGRVTTFTYDQFGTKIADHYPNGTDTAEVTRFVSNASVPGAIQTVLGTHNITLKWARSSQKSGSPWTTVYFDVLGQEVVTETLVLTSSAPTYANQYKVNLYNAKGLLYKTSNPFIAGNPIHWTTTEFDVLDRPIRKDYPDGSSDGVTTLGNATVGGQPMVYTKVYNKRGYNLERWENQQGNLAQSKDPSAQVTSFVHDVEGRLLQVSIDGVTQLTNTYDIFGNVTAVSDLSAGNTSCVFNGFGEAISETNANSQVTTTTYDGAGRVSSVVKPEGTFTNTYRTSSPSKGLPSSIQGPGGYEETFTYGSQQHDYGVVVGTTKRLSSAQPVYTTATSYNALGLVSSETNAGGVQVVHEYDSVYGSFALRTRLVGTRAALISETTEVILDSVPLDGDFPAAAAMKTTEVLANGVTRVTYADPRNGRLLKLYATGVGGTVLQNHRYRWDANGNLEARKDGITNKIETFAYDNLDRLTSSLIAGQSAVPYYYDTKGNLTGKGTAGTHTYSNFRVTSATIKGVSRSYTYNNAGHVTADGKRTFQWTSFGQLKEVYQVSTPALESFATTGNFSPAIPGIASAVQYQASQARATFEFDQSGSRATQTLVRTFADSSEARNVTRYHGTYQIEEHATKPAGGSYADVKTIHRHHIGTSVYTIEDPVSGPDVARLGVVLTDHIGSTDVVVQADWDSTNGVWKSASTQGQAERQSFDAWGDRRSAADWSALRPTDTSSQRTSAMNFDHGFTGHEMLDDFGLVHMNGRIYDPELGRFLSPDPNVQVPEYSQNFNRYSYVLNNPLSYTDTSGHFIDWIVMAVVWVVESVVTAMATYAGAVAAAYTTGGFLAAAGTAIGGLLAPGVIFSGGSFMSAWGVAQLALSAYSMGSTIAAGGDLGDVLLGVAVNFVSGAIASGGSSVPGVGNGGLHKIGTAAKTAFGDGKYALASVETLKHVGGHALLGGVSRAALGGRFEDGFLSAGVSTLMMDAGLGSMFQGEGPGAMLGRTAVAGIVGGTVTQIGGGKFGNGAFTAAWQHLLNAELKRVEIRAQASKIRAAIQKEYDKGTRHFRIKQTSVDTIAAAGLFWAQDTKAKYINAGPLEIMNYIRVSTGDSVFTDKWADSKFTVVADGGLAPCGTFYASDINYYYFAFITQIYMSNKGLGPAAQDTGLLMAHGANITFNAGEMILGNDMNFGPPVKWEMSGGQALRTMAWVEYSANIMNKYQHTR